MCNKYFDGKVSNKNIQEDVDKEFIKKINSLYDSVSKKMDNLQISDALTEIFDVLRASNKYIDETTPWVLAKDENLKDRLETVIYNLLESIRVCGLMLNPFLTITSEEIAKQINNYNKELKYIDSNSYELEKPTALFMRIDTKKE